MVRVTDKDSPPQPSVDPYMTEDRLSKTSKKSAHSGLHDSLLRSEPRRQSNRSPDVGVISLSELRDIREKTTHSL